MQTAPAKATQRANDTYDEEYGLQLAEGFFYLR